MSKRILKTLQYFKEVTWTSMNYRTVNGNNPRPHNKGDNKYLKAGVRLDLTRVQFLKWCDDNQEEIMNLYSSGMTPSIDRKPGYLHYSLESMRVLELKENSRLGSFKMQHLNERKIIGIHKKTGEKIKFQRIIDVSSKGFDHLSVWKALNGLRKSSYGYIWVYAEDQKRKLIKTNCENHIENIDGLVKNATIHIQAERNRKRLSKKIVGTSIKDGSVVKFPSMHEAARNGFNRSCIYQNIRGTIKSHKGYSWEHV